MAIEECYILIYVTIPLFHFQQDSPDTPGKKTKLNELKTPQPKKTLAIYHSAKKPCVEYNSIFE
jgi:hypothetical protein